MDQPVTGLGAPPVQGSMEATSTRNEGSLNPKISPDQTVATKVQHTAWQGETGSSVTPGAMLSGHQQPKQLFAGTPDIKVEGDGKGRNWPRTKKRKRSARDITAPRQPLSGYVRFMNDRREAVRRENPNIPFAEIMKLLASEWGQLPITDKKQFLDAADQDRERYQRELSEYKQTEAYRIYVQKQQEKKKKEEKEAEAMNIEDDNEKEQDISGFDVPIFTEEFLDHNKAREAELRQLRKSNTEYEEQNAILQKHLETMKSAVERLEVETTQQRTNNVALHQHLDNLRATLTTNFSNVHLPGNNQPPTLQTIDAFMTKLHSIAVGEKTRENEALLSQVRSIVGRLEFQG